MNATDRPSAAEDGQILPFTRVDPLWLGRSTVPLVVDGRIIEVHFERYYIEAMDRLEGDVHVDACHPDEVFTVHAVDTVTRQPCRVASLPEASLRCSPPA